MCLLPFQLLNLLGWTTIPAIMAAGYIILGLLFIRCEVENPFGNDDNETPKNSQKEKERLQESVENMV